MQGKKANAGSHSLGPEVQAQKKEELVLSGAVENMR